MGDEDKLMSDAFQVFIKESPKHAQAWMRSRHIIFVDSVQKSGNDGRPEKYPDSKSSCLGF